MRPLQPGDFVMVRSLTGASSRNEKRGIVQAFGGLGHHHRCKPRKFVASYSRKLSLADAHGPPTSASILLFVP